MATAEPERARSPAGPPAAAPWHRPAPARPRASAAPSARARGAGPASTQRGLRVPSRGPGDFWRPWLRAPGEAEERAPRHAAQPIPGGPGMTVPSGKLSQYRHPVRLFWPKSKCYDYLYHEAETLLKSFPVQATISFYEDSDSEDESEELSCENQYN